MPTVEKLSTTMLGRCAKNHGWKYTTDRDGDVRVDFAYSDDTGCELTLWLMAAGQKHNVLRATVYSDKRIPKGDWGRVMTLCNEWNKTRRWPKAYLIPPDSDAVSVGNIALEEQLAADPGIHQELLDDFVDTVFTTAVEFWEWAHKEQQL